MTDEELKQEFQTLKTYILDFRTEVLREFNIVHGRLETISGLVAGLNATIPALSNSALKTETEIHRVQRELVDIQARLRKLEGAA